MYYLFLLFIFFPFGPCKITAETFSQLTDSEGNRLIFDLLDAEADADLLRLKSLVQAKDGVGDLGNDRRELGQGEKQMKFRKDCQYSQANFQHCSFS